MNYSPCLLCHWGTWVGFRGAVPYICLLFTTPARAKCAHFRRTQ